MYIYNILKYVLEGQIIMFVSHQSNYDTKKTINLYKASNSKFHLRDLNYEISIKYTLV